MSESTIRPEQLQAAEAVASQNPEWTLIKSLAGVTLSAFDGGGVAVNRSGQVVWLAYRHEGGYLLGSNGGLRRFLTPTAAIRALGYALPTPDDPTPSTDATPRQSQETAAPSQ